MKINQGADSKELCVFEKLESARNFLELFRDYEVDISEKIEDQLVIDPNKLPIYREIFYNNKLIPLSCFMFRSLEDDIYMDINEIENLDKEGEGYIIGASLVDAYLINNEEVKKYIEKREEKQSWASGYLKSKGYEVDRTYRGSEDGEAIIYRKNFREDWRFLDHLDPCFVNNSPNKKQDFLAWLIKNYNL